MTPAERRRLRRVIRAAVLDARLRALAAGRPATLPPSPLDEPAPSSEAQRRR